MSDDQLTIEALRRWSQILFWVSIVLPVLGAVAAGARYYVERAEKAASSRILDQSLSGARAEAQAARSELSAYKARNAPRRLTQQQRDAVAQAVAGLASVPVVVASRMMDGESLDYATDIAEALRASVPSVPAVVQTSLNDFPGFVAVHSPPQNVPNQQGQLLAGLAAGAVPVRQQQIAVGSIAAYNSSTYYVVVGRKEP